MLTYILDLTTYLYHIVSISEPVKPSLIAYSLNPQKQKGKGGINNLKIYGTLLQITMQLNKMIMEISITYLYCCLRLYPQC